MEEFSVRKQTVGSLGLLAATVIWGMAFVVVKNVTDDVPVAYLVSLRYPPAFLGMFFILTLKTRSFRWIAEGGWKEGAVLGTVLCVSQFFQTLGCKYTTAGKNAFITALYVVLVPFFVWIIKKKRPENQCFLAAFIALAGLGLLSLQGDWTIQPGDGLTMICGIGLAVHIICTGCFVEKHDGLILTFFQFFFAWIVSLLFVATEKTPFPAEIFRFPMAGELLYLGLGSTMAGFLLQTVCQKYIHPNVTAVILSMEAVFGMLFSVWFLKESFTLRILLGCLCMFAAMLLAECRWKTNDDKIRNVWDKNINRK